MNKELSALQLLNLMTSQKLNLIDVRSQGEFTKGHIPGFQNVPILNDDHRHQVGLCYKLHGQDKAIECGHNLVDPIKAKLQKDWFDIAGSGPVYLHCWRGGLRSKFAAEWMREYGMDAITVTEGYKGLRHLFNEKFKSKISFFVLAGLTGTGKTDLLNRLPEDLKIDLESIANHRGSAFGSNSLGSESVQPSQATFENRLGFELYKHTRPFVIEDESRSIGKVHLNKEFYERMQSQPIILQERNLEERTSNIYDEYILKNKKTSEILFHDFYNSLSRIQKRLGGALFKSISEIMTDAFSRNDQDRHQDWISLILKTYYDPLYQSRLTDSKNQIIFSGSTKEVYEFIIDRASRGWAR